MKENFKRGLRILGLFVLVMACAFIGSFALSEFWGRAGEIIGVTITIAVMFLPFAYTNEKNHYDKNLKNAFLILILVYGGLAVFYGIGLLGNLIPGMNTTGAMTALLGFWLVVLFDIVLFLGYLLIRKISNRNLTTK